MLAARHLTALLVAASLSGAVAADYSTDQIEMAANGRFDLLESSVEEYARTHPLTTRDQHTLCYAYSKTKRYTRLLACLEQLEEKVRGGDRRTRLFGLSDATPSVHVMRADALIDLGRYREAIDAATKAVTWLKEDNSTDVDLLFSAFAQRLLDSEYEIQAQLLRTEPVVGALLAAARQAGLEVTAEFAHRVEESLKDYLPKKE